MNALQVFKNEEFGEVRTIKNEKEIWFAAKDVCEMLDIKNTTDAVKNLDVDEVTRLNLGGLSGETNFINESGLYTLIIRSRKPEAKKFRKWITSEVLPAIRKTGMYATEELLENPDLAIQAFQQLKDEREKRKLLESKVEEQRPKVLFADSVESSETSILIGDLAKLIKQNGHDIGQNRLFEWLRNNDYLMKSGERKNMPTQKSMDMKLFEVKERTVNNPDGSIRVTKTTKVTGKGQIYFIDLFLNKDRK